MAKRRKIANLQQEAKNRELSECMSLPALGPATYQPVDATLGAPPSPAVDPAAYQPADATLGAPPSPAIFNSMLQVKLGMLLRVVFMALVKAIM